MSGVNKFTEDMSRVFSGALGVAQGAKGEAETAMKSWMEKFISSQGFVSRDEFNAALEMAKTARAEVEKLRAEVEALKGAKKPASKAATKTPAKPARKTAKKDG